MQAPTHNKVTGFSGNELFCLNKLGYKAGQLCLGNNVLALGVSKSIGASLSNLAGGEIVEITHLVHEGRKNAFKQMMNEAKQYGGVGLAGVTFDLVYHPGNVEFIAMGSTIHAASDDRMTFSTSASGQELYCQKDAGFQPHSFVFSNVAYSIGVGGNIRGMFRSLKRGEVAQFTEIFNRTRHLALERITNEAMEVGANAVINIETSIMPFMGAQEMMMTGTASSHPALSQYNHAPITCDMTNEELWNVVHLGYMPIRLVIGVSVYSLGLVSGIAAIGRSIAGGQVQGLTDLLYEAREKALARIQEDADQCGADEVIGVKTRVYNLGGGLIEFMAIGTAVKKVPGLTTLSEQIIPQAIIQDRETFIDAGSSGATVRTGAAEVSSARSTQSGPLSMIISFIVIAAYIAFTIFRPR